jgi:3-dehydroquinate dehydratase-1
MSPLPLGQRPLVVGSLASGAALAALSRDQAAAACDLVEIRLDGIGGPADLPPWARLRGLPLLFTARRADEGGLATLPAATRLDWLRRCLADAACVDLEVASLGELAALTAELAARGMPWVASYHDFSGPSDAATLNRARERAAAAGAAVFKAAVTLHEVADLLLLAEFQRGPSPVPVATMGMGPLGPVSRLLCAQLGSSLNYGFLGDTPTAPGQWSASELQSAIRRLPPLPAVPLRGV